MCKFLLFCLLLCFDQSFSQELDRSDYQLLWEISGNGLKKNSYLFGTFHNNGEKNFDFPDSLYTVLNNSDAVVIEADITEIMEDLDVIKGKWTESLPEGLGLFIPEKGSDNITYTTYGSDEGRPQFIDMYFKQIADNCGKSVFALEKIEDQLKVGLNNEYKPVKPGYRRPVSEKEIQKYYLEGNITALHDLTKMSVMAYEDLYEDLIVKRNKVMADGIDTLVHDYQIFCAVGSAHLAGEEGIISLLRKKGYHMRKVTANFSEETIADEKEINKCSTYAYDDDRFGFSIDFSGKPLIKDENLGERLIQYQELGQGNTYSVRVSHYETLDDLDEIAADFFKNDELKVVQYTKKKLPDGTLIHEGKIKDGGRTYWMRAFHRNQILYLLYSTGGHRFINSGRPTKFFDSFSFLQSEKGNSTLTEKVKSPTGVLSVLFPKDYHEVEEFNEEDKYWRLKWFNPDNGDNFYVYENVLTDNSMYFSDEAFGEFLVGEFDTDSLSFYNYRQTDDYTEKSFRAKKGGVNAWGKIRLIGNIIHFAQYNGSDSLIGKQFLSSMNFEGFQPLNDTVNIKNARFETTVSKSGFVPLKTEERYGYRTTKHYVLNDPEKVITYEVYIKTFDDWAFSQKAKKTLLMDQIYWPDSTLSVKIDTLFDLSDEGSNMEFEIEYLSSKNIWKGKTFVKGKEIITYSVVYPVAAKHLYKEPVFLQNTRFFKTTDEAISKVDLQALIHEIKNNGVNDLSQLVENDHVNESTALEILFLPDSLYANYDPQGKLQQMLIQKISPASVSDSLIDLWKRRFINSDSRFTDRLLELSASRDDLDYFLTVLNHVEENELKWENPEELLEIIGENPENFERVKRYFVKKWNDSLSWRMTFVLEELTDKEVFRQYLLSESFRNTCLVKNSSEWAAFRYFELFYESGGEKNEMKEILKQWSFKNKDFEKGIKIGWMEVLGNKPDRNTRNRIKENHTTSAAYSRVMAVAQYQKSRIYSFEEITGILAFDNYEDEYYDPQKKIAFIGNESFSNSEGEMTFSVYLCEENKKIYYMVRELSEDRVFPSYKDFGSDTYFFFLPAKLNKTEEIIPLIKQRLDYLNEID
ncbi:MAG: TraB/GumN family protein [Brumimicrobium sp.]|nr:TraB/GumN family protein [Brumimicrobium sp.]